MIGPSRLRGLSSAERTAACLVSLSYLDGIGPATLRRCHLEHGAEETWFDLLAGRSDRVVPIVDLAARGNPELGARLARQARQRDPIADLAAQRVTGRHLVVHGTRGYPERLVADQAAPAVLFMAGHPDVLRRPTAAIVGTRNATLAGRSLAEDLGEGLARAGVTVVSGLALGIDGAAHRGALSPRVDVQPSVTGVHVPRGAVGVIASGLDVVYPRRHAHLHRDLAENALLVTEMPAGMRPDTWRFPARNRIISALADVVVVVESRVTGGSLHTVDEALVRGVPVLAVPGHPSAPASAGTNALIFDGAGLVRDTSDVLLALGLDDPRPQGQPASDGVGAREDTAAERAVMAALGATPSSLAEVVTATGRSVSEVSHALYCLMASGRVAETEGWYEAVPVALGPR